MSRLKRNIVRRDKALHLYEMVQEKQLLNIEPRLVALLKDIPANAFKNARKSTPEWQTLAYVAQTATMSGLWDIQIDTVQQVMPENEETTVRDFRNDWAICKQKTPLRIADFLDLIKGYDVV